MKLEAITSWLDATLEVAKFSDVSNNGVQIGNGGRQVDKVAFAVDASVRAVEAAVASGAGLMVVHHGISWGGGIRRITGGVYNVVKAAIAGDLAIYACHLPLDAHPKYGNNHLLAKELGLESVLPAFSYHGNIIGLTGIDRSGRKVGVCSGGGGEFVEEAKSLGCDLFVTGEASWADVIAAENCGIALECRGHYATEVYGVRALQGALSEKFNIETLDLTEVLA